MRVLDTINVILLDMNSTFMFGEDRFSETEDYYHTYQSVGGKRLSDSQVRHTIQACYEGMSLDYEDPGKYHNFPSLQEGFHRYANVDEADLAHLVDTFAAHELGHISEEYASYLKQLASTHVLGLVANIWAPKDKWLAEFSRVGIQDVFTNQVFSSEMGCIKPAPQIYKKALEGLQVHHSEILFVGDSLKYDMEGAKNMGFNTAWINDRNIDHPLADHVIPSLLHLEHLTVKSI